MKKLLLIICCLCFLLCGCTSVSVEKENTVESEKLTSMFIEVESTSYWNVVYHKETKVMYVVSNDSYIQGIFTMLVNSDGTPMLYEGGDAE